MNDGGDDFTYIPDDPELTNLEDLDSGPSERIGNYRILQKVAEGGMGIVYEAEQLRPVRRRVALKVIKLGMDTEQVVSRFESERQALALMDHPNIAKVYDAGATEQGRPFFAMEFVRGQSIVEYCDRLRMSTRDRLKLFIRVCEGVHHAHQKGIIHRDIKPSNVLVLEVDGHHVPKIIDFGISKATAAHRLSEKTVFTEMGQLVGTPEYMSPEQAEMGTMDVDTRTDVYLLGVMFYELLVGELPFDSSELRRTGLNEFRRKVIEDEPPRPSTRLGQQGERLDATAANRSTMGRSLTRLLKGDLDWIAMRALEKDRTRRYPSASEMALDVRRYLDNEPVLAGAPGGVYRLGKFVRRHKTGAAFATVLFVLLAGFASSMAVLATRLAEQRDLANQEAATAKTVSDFLEELFVGSDPVEALGDEITAREIMDAGAERIEAELGDQPLVQARMMNLIGNVYNSIGLKEKARPLLERALEIRRRELTSDHPDLAENMDNLAALLSVSYGEMDRARRLYEEALRIRKKQLDPRHPALASSMNNLAIQEMAMGNDERAIELFQQAFEIWESTLGPDDENTIKAMNNRGGLLAKAGRHAEAEELLLKVLATRGRLLPPNHPDVARARVNLALAYEKAGDLDSARAHYRVALEIRDEVFGGSHRKVADVELALATVELRRGDRTSADAHHARAMEIYEEGNALESGFVLYNLARYAGLSGRREEGLAWLRQAVVERGLKNQAELLEEPAFADWHDDPEFKLILAGSS